MSQLNTALRPPETVTFQPAEKMRGLPLFATWTFLVAAPWAAIYGVVTLAL